MSVTAEGVIQQRSSLGLSLTVFVISGEFNLIKAENLQQEGGYMKPSLQMMDGNTQCHWINVTEMWSTISLVNQKMSS